MAFVTYAHHALIQVDRKGAILGTLITVVLAIIFTAFQGYEYSQAPFTIADSVFGSAFFASTGLHGLTYVPTKLTIRTRKVEIKTSLFKVKKIHNSSDQFISTKSINSYPRFARAALKSPFTTKIVEESKLNIPLNSKKILYLERSFLEWLVGFTDAEGNFNISLLILMGITNIIA